METDINKGLEKAIDLIKENNINEAKLILENLVNIVNNHNNIINKQLETISKETDEITIQDKEMFHKFNIKNCIEILKRQTTTV